MYGFRKEKYYSAMLISYLLNANPIVSSEFKHRQLSDNKIISCDKQPQFFDQKVYKITINEISDKLKDFEKLEKTDKGDPFFYSLLSLAEKAEKGLTYCADGEDLRKLFIHELLRSGTKTKNGKTFYKTTSPVHKMEYVSAKIIDNNIAISSKLDSRYYVILICDIPEIMNFNIDISMKDTDKDRYYLSMNYFGEKPELGLLIKAFTRFDTNNLITWREDEHPNLRKIYWTINSLVERELIKPK